jgi:hypothetical protein
MSPARKWASIWTSESLALFATASRAPEWAHSCYLSFGATWARRQHEGGGHAPETILGNAYGGQLRAESKRKSEGLGEQSAMLDMDRLVSRLPEGPQRVLIAEYAISSRVDEKARNARLAVSTYYCTQLTVSRCMQGRGG